MEHFESWKDLVNPEFYIKLGGFWLVLLIVFAESGLFFGFFLPGDSLLFISGIYSTTMIRESVGSLGSDFLDTTLLAFCVGIAAILGDSVGYWFGAKSGPMLYERKETLFFKRNHLLKAQEFYEENGALAIIIARFLPMIRTFAPIVAGIVKMDRKKFLFYNVAGGFLWSFSLIFAGHYLDKFFIEQFDIDLKKHLEYIIIGLIIVTTTPVIIKAMKKSPKK
ncbi:MAG: VTT domain-containing protein [Flavobacteriaceae bacterium]|nr:VTT domain-containing protein [Flavobacteriaceae bacterium]